MNISIYFKAGCFQLRFMRILIGTSHIIIRMIASHHHDWHERYMLHAIGLELRDNRLQIRPALNRVDENIFQTKLIDTVLNDGIIRVGRMRRAMCHQKDSVLLALLRELRLDSLDELNEIIALLCSLAGLGASLLLLRFFDRRIAGKPEWSPRVAAVYTSNPTLSELHCSNER